MPLNRASTQERGAELEREELGPWRAVWASAEASQSQPALGLLSDRSRRPPISLSRSGVPTDTWERWCWNSETHPVVITPESPASRKGTFSVIQPRCISPLAG